MTSSQEPRTWSISTKKMLGD